MRDFVMLPRAARLWAAFLAYAVLLAAVFVGQTIGGVSGGAPLRDSPPAASAGDGEL